MSVSAPRSGLRMPHRASGIAFLVGMVAVLTGCAGIGLPPASVALSDTAGFPADAPIAQPFDDPTWAGEPVGWLADDRSTLTIVSYGSSSCPFIATAIEVVDETELSIDLRQAPAQACTDDLAPHTHVLAVPAGWGEGEGPYSAVVARFADAFGASEPTLSTILLWPVTPESGSIAVETVRGVPDDVTLPEGSLDKGDPLAYWGEGRATLRVITWGSSSCPPPALSLDVVSPSELALVFGALPPVACTADFAPTTHVLEVPEGLDAGTVTLAITIEQRDAASLQYRIPISD